MIDTNIYTQFPEYGAFTCDDVKYNPDKVHIKDLLYDHYNWFEELDKTGKARPCVLDNVQKTLLCNSVYLGFDIFECPSCKNEMIIHKNFIFGSVLPAVSKSRDFSRLVSKPSVWMSITATLFLPSQSLTATGFVKTGQLLTFCMSLPGIPYARFLMNQFTGRKNGSGSKAVNFATKKTITIFTATSKTRMFLA